MGAYTQATRPMTIESVLGADKLLLLGLYGEEGVSSPAVFTLDLASEDPQIPAERMLGSAIAIGVETSAGVRRLHGIVRRFTQGERSDRRTEYQAEMVAWPWLLSLDADFRVFQNQSVPEIVEEVVKARGFSDFELRLRGSYAPREYCVQHGESDLAFISRLLEEEGIFWFVEHEKSKHVVVFADQPSVLKPLKNAESIHMAAAGAGWEAQDVVITLHADHRMHSGKVTLSDFDMEKPTARLLRTEGGDKGEIYAYPGGYRDADKGERLGRLRVEAEEVHRQLVRGESTSRHLRPGGIVEITGHYRRSFNAKYQILQVRHSIQQGLGDAPFEYRNEFLAMPHDVPYRPPRLTPKQRTHGVTTAIVVGPSGEEIWTDKYGRVKVQFHWDRVGKKDDKSSCWVRVSTPWAGKNFGAIHIPRVGDEVLVDFLHGDPDQPYVIGSLYNGEKMPPHTLPANQTQSGIKTRSSKSGAADNANELRFEDKKGSEQILLHAERDLKIEVENDEIRDIENERKTTVKKDDTRTVKEGNDVVKISKGDQTLDIAAGKQTVTIQGNQAITVKQGNQELIIKMGNQKTEVKLGKSSSEAMQSIELKVGQNSIKIDQAGVTIKGMQVKVEGQIQAQVKAPITQINGDGMVKIQGGLTMIN
ncbi:MAG TPA: type VI secretion system tip protein TssI/VgrG [Gemmatimonadaceae bacterium]|nr:type VI secretion system tip protein TssI/VgrG [Gemmatimonadaceae bacterium]